MKKLFVLSLAGVMFAGAGQAAIMDLYIGATGGLGGQHYFIKDAGNHNEYAKSYGAVFGIDIPVIRAEIEYNYLKTDVLETNLAMANIMAKIFPMPIITPYIGAGAGMQFDGRLSDVSLKNARSTWAAQGLIGASVDIPLASLSLDAEGRAVYLPNFAADAQALHYELRAKLRYTF
ncbi:MAG: hypothetical protein LBL75_01505 [Rickettsiales bacterium]|jgi:hypothetical protein|nr:hypothetical protein [Rickettsiales bacterium]